MSGGIAYVLDIDGTFRSGCNQEMVDLESARARRKTSRPSARCFAVTCATRTAGAPCGCSRTGSTRAARFVKIIPRDYKRVLIAEAKARSENREPAFAELVGASHG